MARIRIYEAAKKLNIDTKDLMAMLNGRGITVKSPISFITQSDYDEVLDSMTSDKGSESEEDGADEKVVSLKAQKGDEDAREPAGLISETDPVDMGGFKLTLVSKAQEETAKSDAEGKTEAEALEPDTAHEPVTEKEPETGPAISVDEQPPEEETVEPEVASEKAPVAAMASEPTGRTSISSILSFAAIGIAAAALLVTFMLQGNVANNTEAAKSATQSVAAMQAQVATANTGVISNQNQINANRAGIENVNNRVSAMNKARVKSSLSGQAAALEEVSTALPQNVADKVRAISKGLSSLSSSI